jgi:hypothetical protein
MLAGYSMAIDVSAREHLVVVIKGTFRMPVESGGRLLLHEEQVPLVMSDVFFGEPGLSAPKYEVDFAPRKPRCEVLLNGNAYAPGGQPALRVTVGLQIGGWFKSLAVVGDRFWYHSGGPSATDPTPFQVMPITYDRAFGGMDLGNEDPAQDGAYMPNPSGRGFHKVLLAERLEGTPLPNTEEIGVPIARPDRQYRPMSFGPIGRHWDPRYRYAGTYDQKWLDHVFPFLPADFDERYFQSAPADQQLEPLEAEQSVTLLNLTPDGRRDFTLPHFEAPVSVFPNSGGREDLKAAVDTIVIEPDLERVTMTWRIARPLRKNMFEISQILVGRKGQEWWQQREALKFPIPVVVEPLRPKAETPESAT